MEETKKDFTTESRVTYDDRRKMLVHETTTVEKAKGTDGKIIGEVKTIMTGTYEEAGIKNIYKNLNQDITVLQQNLKNIRAQLETLKEIEINEDVKKFKEITEKVSKLKQKEQLETQEKEYAEKLKFNKKSLIQIKEVIGSRLKL